MAHGLPDHVLRNIRHVGSSTVAWLFVCMALVLCSSHAFFFFLNQPCEHRVCCFATPFPGCNPSLCVSRYLACVRSKCGPHVLVAYSLCVWSCAWCVVFVFSGSRQWSSHVLRVCRRRGLDSWIPKVQLVARPLSATFGARVCSWRLGLSRLFFWQFRFFVKFYDRCAFGEVELSRFSSVFSCTGQRNHSWKRSPLNTTTEVN